MDQAIYSLQELADASGLEPRTIRSYMQRDLVPGPQKRGRNATYSAESLDRLKVISMLRAARPQITLDQIRLLLQQLSPSQIRGIADGSIRIGALIDTDERQKRESALAYLQRISQPVEMKTPFGRGLHKRTYAASPGQSDIADLPPVEQLLAALMKIIGSQPVPSSVRSELWLRLPITPDFEVSVRGAFTTEQVAQLHRIGDHLRTILTRGVKT